MTTELLMFDLASNVNYHRRHCAIAVRCKLKNNLASAYCRKYIADPLEHYAPPAWDYMSWITHAFAPARREAQIALEELRATRVNEQRSSN